MTKSSERRKYYDADLKSKSKMMNVHVSKELRTKLGTKDRSIIVNKGDTVKIMRGGKKGTVAKVARVNYIKLAVYIEGVSRKNAKGTETLVRFQPSNLMLVDLNMTADRKKVFSIKEEKPAKAEAKQ